MRRESHVRFCEGLEVKFLGPTRLRTGHVAGATGRIEMAQKQGRRSILTAGLDRLIAG
jgi:hypothetical protein